MWIILGIILVVGWVALKIVWGVASFAVHALLILGVIAIIVHFVRRRLGGHGRHGSPS